MLACIHLAKRHEVKLVTFGKGGGVKFANEQGLDVVVIPPQRVKRFSGRGLFWRAINRSLTPYRVISEIRKTLHLLWVMSRTDLVYVNTIAKSLPVTAAYFLGKPVVVHVREAENYFHRKGGEARRISRLLRRASAVICVSEAVRQLVHETPNTGLEASQVHVVHNGINYSHFQIDEAERRKFRSEYGIQPFSRVVLFIGNYAKRKGVDLFLRSIDCIAPAYPDVHFLVVGGAKESGERRRKEFLGNVSADQVHFLGTLDDVRPALWAADIFVMLSRVEPFARVNLEASASGCAILATRVGGNTEIFRNEENALLVESDDLSAIINGLERLLNDSSLRIRLSQRAKEIVCSDFRIDICNNRIESILEETVAK